MFSYWQYRRMRTGGRVEIREVYFDAANEVVAWVAEPASVYGTDEADLADDLQGIVAALDLPVLDEADLRNDEPEPTTGTGGARFNGEHLAQLRASAASAGLTRNDALAVLDELEHLQAANRRLVNAEAHAARWKRSYETARDEAHSLADEVDRLRAEQ